MSVEENTIRDDLEKAFDQHTAESSTEARGPEQNAPESVRDPSQGEKPEATGTEASGESGEGTGDSGGRDEKGRFKSGEKAEGQPTGAGPEGAQKAEVAPEKEQQVQQAQEPLAAPAGWKAGPREQWKNIPRAAQEEIHRREKETAQTLRQSAQARQLANDFQATINPFMPLIQSQNSNPLQAVKNLMTTAAGLTVGTQQQKAQIVREIIQNYGIDINTLDQVLAGQPIQQGAPTHNAPPPWAAPIFQFMNGIQQQQQTRQQQMISDAEAETADFASKNEFFEDLREDMADMMELAAKRGVVLSIQDAYDRCAQLDPNIAPIISQRKAAVRSTQNTNIQRSRNAASSIAGAPRNKAGSAPGAVGEDRRAALEEAWEQATGR